MYSGSSYLCVFVLWSGKLVELLFIAFQERIVACRPVGNNK